MRWTKDAVVAFLYQLTRDEIVPGKIEVLMNKQRGVLTEDGWGMRDDIISEIAERWGEELKKQTELAEEGDSYSLTDYSYDL